MLPRDLRGSRLVSFGIVFLERVVVYQRVCQPSCRKCVHVYLVEHARQRHAVLSELNFIVAGALESQIARRDVPTQMKMVVKPSFAPEYLEFTGPERREMFASVHLVIERPTAILGRADIGYAEVAII